MIFVGVLLLVSGCIEQKLVPSRHISFAVPPPALLSPVLLYIECYPCSVFFPSCLLSLDNPK